MPDLPSEIWSLIHSFLPTPADRTTFCRLTRSLSLIGLRTSLASLTVFRHLDDFSTLSLIASNSAHASFVRSLTYIPFRLEDVVFSDYKRFKDHVQNRGIGRVWRLYRPSPPEALMKGYYEEVKKVKEMEKRFTVEIEEGLWREVLPKLEGLREVWMWNGTSFHVESVMVRELGRTLVERTPFDGTGCCLWPDGRYPGTGMRGALAMMGGLENLGGRGVTELHIGPADWEWLREMPRLEGLMAGLVVLDLQFELPVREDESFEDRLGWCREMLKEGYLRDILVGMPGVRDLAIRSTPTQKAMPSNRSMYPVKLEQVIQPGHKWPNLRFLALGGMHLTRDGLTEILNVHRETLRRLDLGFVGLDAHWTKSGILLGIHELLAQRGLETHFFGFLDGPWEGYEPGDGYELQWQPSDYYDCSHAANYGMQKPRWPPTGGGRLANLYDAPTEEDLRLHLIKGYDR
ncbi:hypothetical protein B0T16DRAFT_214444 [Cercophora newfieldiana]|uniref:Uncharacterized protein n=1 Tax=Cercophora newfieldiana TaxID=92897 RepID=A0AA39XW89_9PEZI|nr:hypothetical protein B0T16DRAFT_214444 [Cercophora newfieldiana]